MSQGDALDVFRQFCSCDEFHDVIKTFKQLCALAGAEKHQNIGVYKTLQAHIKCSEASNFFSLMEKRRGKDVYQNGTVGQGRTVLIIGGGPCGLRTAVECALLGLRVTVVERRDYISRKNVLHLWPSAVSDLKAIGAKVFYPKFCSGSIHHISICRLQLILLKVALLLGVEIYTPAVFEELLVPNPNTGAGWRASINPPDCPLNKIDFDIIVGADGRANSLEFPRTFTRGKVSIAITANFKNPNSGLHTRVKEIPGVIRVRNPELFHQLQERTGLEFENFLYFRDETHYFIMTAKKKGLIDLGIVKKDTADLNALFHPKNMDMEKLSNVVKQIALTAWRVENPTLREVPDLEFELDRQGREDIAVFDFAALHQAKHACMVKERHKQKLLMCIVGDTLLEPFWPSGSGIAKGFLGVLDAVWTMRRWLSGEKSDLEIIAERESIFRILPQVTPENLSKDAETCTIDPRTRYGGTTYGGRLPLNTVKPEEVQHLYSTADALKRKIGAITIQEVPKEKRALYRGGSIDTHHLLTWFKQRLRPYSRLCNVTDMARSWNNGLALCALIHSENPRLIDIDSLDRKDSRGNIQMAFEIIEKEFGIEQMMAADDLANNNQPDRLTMMSYLFHIYEYMTDKENKDVGISTTAFGLLRNVGSSEVLLKTMKRDKKWINSLRCKTLAWCAANKNYKSDQLDYFVKTASLDRRDRMKVYQAIKKSRSVRFTQKALQNKKVSPAVKRVSHVDSVQESQCMQDENQRMSLSRMACKGLASERINAFRSLENKAKQDSEGVVLKRRDAFRSISGGMTTKMSSSTLKRKKNTGEICCICEKKLYIIERCYLQGYFFHRQCLKCMICDTELTVGNCVVTANENDKPQCFCSTHAYQHDYIESSSLSQTDDSSDINIYGPITEEESKYFSSDRDDDDDDDDDDNDDDITEDEKEDKKQNIYASLKSITADSNSDGDDSSDYEDVGEWCSEVSNTSIQLLQLDQIQQGLSEIKDEQDRIEKEGIELEKQIRGTGSDDLSYTSDDLLNAWLNIAIQKKEMKEKEAKLMLRLRLMALQERLKALLTITQNADDNGSDAVEAEVSEMEKMMDSMEEATLKQDIVEIVDTLRKMKLFLNDQ